MIKFCACVSYIDNSTAHPAQLALCLRDQYSLPDESNSSELSSSSGVSGSSGSASDSLSSITDSTGITTVKSSSQENSCLSFLFPHPPRLNLSSYPEFKKEFYSRNYFYQNITKSQENLFSYTRDNFRIDIKVREAYEILSHSYIFNFKNNWTSLNTSYLGK